MASSLQRRAWLGYSGPSAVVWGPIRPTVDAPTRRQLQGLYPLADQIGVPGPYCVEASQAYVAGSKAGTYYLAGTTEAQVFIAGSVITTYYIAGTVASQVYIAGVESSQLDC